MKEFNFTIDDSLKRGLRPESRVPANTGYLRRMDGLRPLQVGAATPELYDIVLDGEPWPFPQVFVGKSLTIVAGRTVVYSVSNSGVLTSLVSGITPGGPWHFLDFGPTWVLTNGVSSVDCAGGVYTKQTAVPFQTGCAFWDARPFMGGFDPAKFWLAAWEAIVEPDAETYEAYNNVFAGAGPNWVWWGSVGGGDLFWYRAVPSNWKDLFLRNEWGLAPMPWFGTVQSIRPMGRSVVVYGTGGVTALVPTGNTFGLKDIEGMPAGIGVVGRGAVHGDDTGHVFVGTDGDLWGVRGDLTAVRLGYGEYLTTMTPANINISYDPRMREHWIGDGTKAFILTPQGLGGPVPTPPACLARHPVMGLISGGGGRQEDVPFCIETGIIDIAERGGKHITTVQMTAKDLEVGGVYVDGSSNGRHYGSRVFPFNRDGVSFPSVSFAECNIGIAGSFGHDGLISRVEVRYNPEDMRFRRGTKGITEQEADPDG